MTIETQQGKKSWIGDGSTTNYPYSYPFLNASDIEVYLDGEKQASGFSVQKKTDYSTGANIIFDVAPAEGVLIVVRRNIPMTQEISYPENGEFPAKSHEKSLDKLTMLIIDNNTEALKVNPATPEDFNPAFPVPEANKALKITADGKGFAMSDYDPDIVLVLTEDFKNQAQQAAIDALASQNIATEQANIATEQANIATEQATIATNKASEVIESGNTVLSNIDTAKDNAITSITNQETTSKTSLIDEGATQVGLIQNEGATQVANVQSTGFYMRDDKLYFTNSQGEETEFKSGGGLELCDTDIVIRNDEKIFNQLLEMKQTSTETGTDTVTINSAQVKIPYTLSKTGSKIVDVAYRDSVIDLYEQEGQAVYYTIDEENQNFTLPMGEIYGMILKNILRIGEPRLTLGNVLPPHCIWLEGATVSRTTYSKLFAIYGTTYGSGNGSTTFVLPNFLNRAIWGSNGFGYLSAGLPNIISIGTGEFRPGTNFQSGASYMTNIDGDKLGGSTTMKLAGFNASLVSSIYGNSTTVQPPAIKVRVYTRYQ